MLMLQRKIGDVQYVVSAELHKDGGKHLIAPRKVLREIKYLFSEENLSMSLQKS